MSNRSLNSLERSRIPGYRKIAEKAGIKFMDLDSYDIKLYDKNQYDILGAMKSGRRAIEEYILKNESYFL